MNDVEITTAVYDQIPLNNENKENRVFNHTNTERFKLLGDTELDNIAEAVTEKNTKSQTKWATKLFKGMHYF